MEAKYIYSLDIKVRDYELDAEGIVNNANYLHYLEYSRHCFCEQAGYTFRQMSEDGNVPVLKHIEVDYMSPLHSGDTMESKLWLEIVGVRFIFHQDIFDKATGKQAIKAKATVVNLHNGKLSRGEKFIEAFAPLMK